MIRKWLIAALASTSLAACSPAVGGAAPAAAGQATAISASERQQGTQAHPEIVKEFGGAYSGSQAAYVERVGRKIAVQSGLSASPSSFNVTLLNSPVNNAMAIPGGYIYSTRQLLALMNDEAELAGVLGHEVAHVAARHSAQRQSVANRNAILGALGQVLLGSVAGNTGLGQILSQGIGTGVELATRSYSRKQETDSDDLAVQYLARAGYDPRALATMLQSLAAQTSLDARISGQDNRTLPPWASTHPDPASRVQRAASMAARTGATGVRNRDAFLAAIDGMLYGEDPRQGVIEGRTFLHPDLRIAFTVPQGFTMANGSDAVSISGSGAQGQFRTAAYSGNLESYVASALRSLAGSGTTVPQAAVQRTTVNGMQAAYTTVGASSGSTQVDLTIFAIAPSSSRAYHFVIVTPRGQGLGPLASTIQSFRTLSASEAAAIKPRYLRVITVGSRDTLQSLARRMAYTDFQMERFLVLNNLASTATLTPGQKVKIVTY